MKNLTCVTSYQWNFKNHMKNLKYALFKQVGHLVFIPAISQNKLFTNFNGTDLLAELDAVKKSL